MSRSPVLLTAMFFCAAHLLAADDTRTYDQILQTKNKTVTEYFLLCPDLSVGDRVAADSGELAAEDALNDRKLLLGSLDDKDAEDLFGSPAVPGEPTVDAQNAFIQVKGTTAMYGAFTLTFAYYQKTDKTRVPGWSLVLEHAQTKRGVPPMYAPIYLHRFYNLGAGDGATWKPIDDAELLPPGNLRPLTKDQKIAALPCTWQVDIPRYGTVTSLIPRPVGPGQYKGDYRAYLNQMTLFMESAVSSKWDKAGVRFIPSQAARRPDAIVIAGQGLPATGPSGTAVVWRDGVLAVLDSPPGLSDTEARAVVLSPQGEFVAGAGHNVADEWVLVVWRDGVPAVWPFPQGVTQPKRTALTLGGLATDGQSVYVAATPGSNPSAPILWKDGVGQILPTPAAEGFVKGLIVKNGAVWAGGWVSAAKTRKNLLAFWKDGQLNLLMKGLPEGQDIVLADTGMGERMLFLATKRTDTESVGQLWDTEGNIQEVPLTESGVRQKSDNQAQALVLGTGDGFCYVAVDVNGKYQFWKDGKPLALAKDAPPFNDSDANGLAVTASDTLIVGVSNNGGEDADIRAGFWRASDGSWNLLDPGDFGETAAYSITVSKKE